MHMGQFSGQSDYSLLDKSEILEFIFYPRSDWTPVPPGASDFFAQVAEGVHISCRFYPATHRSPCLLFFHGNGEVACDYDEIASLYNEIDVSLFVADYRGYGRSDGKPSFSSMLADAHPIFELFRHAIREKGHTGPIVVMGRSLGIHSTVELALNYAKEISGIIVESGAARMARLLSLFGPSLAPNEVKRLEATIVSRVHTVAMPVLIIHGERDSLIPAAEAVWLHETLGSRLKRLVIIPGADHNDIMFVGGQQYFSAIKDFLRSVAR